MNKHKQCLSESLRSIVDFFLFDFRTKESTQPSIVLKYTIAFVCLFLGFEQIKKRVVYPLLNFLCILSQKYVLVWLFFEF
jgi:hypothetical protein